MGDRKFLTGALFVVFALLILQSPLSAQTAVTLRSPTAPSTGQAGVTVLTVIGSNFPSGVIPPGNVTITLTPETAGSAPIGSTTAGSVATLIGSTRRVTFQIPTSIQVSTPTAYQLSLSGTTSNGTAFVSANNAALTVNPPAAISLVNPNTAEAGAGLSIDIAGDFTNFVQGSTQASLGDGISVGGGAEGSFGPITVHSPTSATAQVSILPDAAAGLRSVTVKTGLQQASLENAFTVTIPNRLPTARPGGPYSGAVGEAIAFNGSASSDPDNDPLSFSWTFGDGATGNGPTPSHAFANTGTFTVTLSVDDGRGGIHSATTTATITGAGDTTPPAVSITSPTPLALFNQSPISVSGTIDDSTATVVVNGVAATVSGGTFTATGVPLREGHNLLTAAATDPVGNVGSSSTTVTLDTTPPTISIDAPTQGAIVTSSQVTVTGMINDIVSGTVNGEQATVTVNGVSATLSNRSFVVPDLLLVRGTNTITAVARDRAGNQSQTRIQVTFQDLAGQQRIVMVSGNNQSGVIGTALAEPLVVRLVDANGSPIANRPVTFTVARTDGIVKAFPDEGREVTVQTDQNGRAGALFQLGTRTGAGNNQVVVSSPGFIGEVVFCASGTVGAPALINADAVMGENFRGIAGAPLPSPFVAIVFDGGGNPVAGVPVTFAVLRGGGNIEGLTSVVKTTNSDGKATAVLTLGLQEGIGNNIVSASFPEMTGVPVIFTASGVIPGPAVDTRVSGVVLDNSDTPIPGATAKIVGTDLSAITNAEGQFTIHGAPVGTITLIVDGSTSSRPETFPFLAFLISNLSGQDNTIGMPIYLPPLDAENSKIVGGDEEAVLVMKGVPGVAFTVFPHSATFPDGSTVGRMTLSQVHADKVPMPPPYGTAPRIVWTLQPAGVHFEPPIRVQLPNADGMPPGQVIEIFQFDHDIEQFVSVGAARVSADGSVIVSDPGFGVTKSGWGGAPPPPPPKKCVGKAPPCQKCDETTGTFVADAAKDGQACEDTDRNYEVACGADKIKVEIDASCSGVCKSGACENKPFGINSMKSAVNAAIGKLCDSCVGDPLKSTMKTNLKSKGFVLKCANELASNAGACAEAGVGGNNALIAARSVTAGEACATVAVGSTILHEMVHAFGNEPGDQKTVDCETACFAAVTRGANVGNAAGCK